MPIYKRTYTENGKKKGVWWFGFWWNGQHIQRSTKLQVGPKKNRLAAKDAESVYRAALAKGEVGILERKPAPILKDFTQRFIDNVGVGRRRAPRESTVMFYAECLNQILSFEPLASARLNEITPELVERFVKSRKDGLSAARVNGMLRTLRRCLQVALELDLILKVPKITLLQGERERDYVLSPEQERVYLSTCPQPLADMAVFLLGTGLRLGEACHLDWRYVHLEPVSGYPFGFVHVAEGKSKNAKRNVRLTSRVQKMLKGRRESTHSIWVFENEEGTGPLSKSTVCHQHIERRRLLKMSKDFVIHSFRHTMLTRLAAAGADVFWIKKLAGHSSITVSEKYVHPASESLDGPFERFEAAGVKSLSEGPKLLEVTTVPTTVEDGQPGSITQVA